MNFKLISAAIFTTLCAVILMVQLNWIYSVSATDPLTTPISTPIIDDEVTPTPTDVVVTPTPTEVPLTPTVTPTQAPIKEEVKGSSSSNSSVKESFTCTNARPMSPVLIASLVSGNSSAKIVWAKGLGEATSYVIWYGTATNYYSFATAHITGSDIMSSTINGLESGKTYYFRVQSYNGCMPGELSKEAKVAIPAAKATIQMSVYYPESMQDKILDGISVTPTPKVTVIEDKVMGESYTVEVQDETFIEWIWNSITGFFKNLFS